MGGFEFMIIVMLAILALLFVLVFRSLRNAGRKG